MVSAQQQAALKVEVLEGWNAIHDVQRRTSSPTRIEVRDERNSVVEGATVQFKLPDFGPSGRFADGTNTYEVETNASGQARMADYLPNTVEGQFELAVTVTSLTGKGTILIPQRNGTLPRPVPAEPNARKGGKRRTLMILLTLGIGIGTAVAVSMGNRPDLPPRNSATKVSLGPISVGGPR